MRKEIRCSKRVFSLPEYYSEFSNSTEFFFDRKIERGLGEKPALIYDNEEISYRRCLARVSQYAHLFRKKGVGKGEEVLIMLPNTPEFIYSFFGAQRMGAVPVPLSTLLNTKEMGWVVSDLDPRAVIYEEDYESVVEGVKAEKMKKIRLWKEKERIEGMPDKISPVGEAEDIAGIFYTSGSRGRPTATYHIHKEAMVEAVTSKYAFGLGERDVFSGLMPLSTSGWEFLIGIPLGLGATTTFVKERRNASKTIENAIRHDVSVFTTVPTGYKKIIKEVRGLEKVEFDTCLALGEVLSRGVKRRWEEKTGCPIYNLYGMTELFNYFICHQKGRDNAGIGFPAPGYEVRLEKMKNKKGLIAVRGPSAAMLKKEKMKGRVTEDGFFITNDIARKDEKGRFYFVGRNDETFMVSGRKIIPSEIEHLLENHPLVNQAAVVPFQSEDGRTVKAFVVLSEQGEGIKEKQPLIEKLQEFVKKEIAFYKYPREIEFLDELPTNQTGKVDKKELKARN